MSQARTIGHRLLRVGWEVLRSVALLGAEALAGLAGGVAIGIATLGVTIVVGLVAVLLWMLATLLWFSALAGTIADLIAIAVIGLGYGLIPLFVGLFAVQLVRPGGAGYLSATQWQFPWVLLVGPGVVVLGLAWLGWTGRWWLLGAGIVAGSLLFRGVSFAQLHARQRSQFADPLARRVARFIPDPATVGPIAFGLGTALLAGGLVSGLTQAFLGPIGAAVTDLLAAVSLGPDVTGIALGVPALLGLGLIVGYGGLDVILRVVAARQTLARRLQAGLSRARQQTITGVRWLAYWGAHVILLRPRS